MQALAILFGVTRRILFAVAPERRQKFPGKAITAVHSSQRTVHSANTATGSNTASMDDNSVVNDEDDDVDSKYGDRASVKLVPLCVVDEGYSKEETDEDTPRSKQQRDGIRTRPATTFPREGPPPMDKSPSTPVHARSSTTATR